jgi:uncharacterized coiled-coil protein SlyX
MRLNDKEIDVQFLQKQIDLLDGENSRLRRDNEALLKSLENKAKQVQFKTSSDVDVDNLKKLIIFQEQQIRNLEEKLKYQAQTIKSLQENMVDSQVHKIPQYQKTIVFLNESVNKLQEENEVLKRKIRVVDNKQYV